MFQLTIRPDALQTFEFYERQPSNCETLDNLAQFLIQQIASSVFDMWEEEVILICYKSEEAGQTFDRLVLAQTRFGIR